MPRQSTYSVSRCSIVPAVRAEWCRSTAVVSCDRTTFSFAVTLKTKGLIMKILHSSDPEYNQCKDRLDMNIYIHIFTTIFRDRVVQLMRCFKRSQGCTYDILRLFFARWLSFKISPKTWLSRKRNESAPPWTMVGTIPWTMVGTIGCLRRTRLG